MVADVDAVQLRILTHYAAGTELSSIAAMLRVDRDEVLHVVQTLTGFNRSKASDMLRRSYEAPTRAERPAPAKPAETPSPRKRGRPAGRTAGRTAPIDTASAYRSIASQLREAIAAGQYAPGACIPSATSLAGQYGVSKKTAEKAVQLLKDDGLLTATQGLGTFVAVPNTGQSPEAAPPAVEPPAPPVPAAAAPRSAPVQRSPSPAASPRRQPAPSAVPERLGWWDAFLCLVCNGRSFLPNDCCGRQALPVTVTVTRREVPR